MVESSKAVGPWRERVALTAHQAMNTLGEAPFAGPVNVVLWFVMPRPKSAPKAKPVAATKRPDLDKLVRACFDSMTHVCFVDDSQVVGLKASKRVAVPDETPGVYIAIDEEP